MRFLARANGPNVEWASTPALFSCRGIFAQLFAYLMVSAVTMHAQAQGASVDTPDPVSAVTMHAQTQDASVDTPDPVSAVTMLAQTQGSSVDTPDPVSAVTMHAQTQDASIDTPAPVSAAVLPFRLEVGGYGTYFQNAGGWWRGVDTTLWIRSSPKFIPALTFDSRTSNAGTERYYSFFSYANWTPGFYTTQSLSGTAATGDKPLLFPRFRYDVKAWFKLPPHRTLVAGLGITRYMFDHGFSGVILNPGLLYYRGRFVFDAEGFINRNQPGGLWSGSGQLTVQRGREGQCWAGVTIGAGHQTYRELENQPLEVRFASVSVDAFYRRWLTRHVGFVLSGGYQDAFHTYQRASAGAHVFFEF